MADWRPINTAPRDGGTILVYLPAHAGLPIRQDVVAIYWSPGGGWVTAYSNARLDAEPTYWMPLPGPPASAAVPQAMADRGLAARSADP
jgi:hypothetical protein